MCITMMVTACDLGHKHALSVRKSIMFLVSPNNHCYRDAFPFEKGKRNVEGCMPQLLLQELLAILDRIYAPSVLLYGVFMKKKLPDLLELLNYLVRECGSKVTSRFCFCFSKETHFKWTCGNEEDQIKTQGLTRVFCKVQIFKTNM